MKTILSNYVDDRMRRCPSFAATRRATQEFIAHNNQDPKLAARLRDAMTRWSQLLLCEFQHREYLAGPVGNLP